MGKSVGADVAARPSPGWPPIPTGTMGAEARDPGLLPRKAVVLNTFTPESAAALPGPGWLQRRRSAAAEAFWSTPLPTEKDEVWRYSRIDQLDLDRFHPAAPASTGASDRPALLPSEQIHALIGNLGPRSALMVTIDGVLATVASGVDEDLLALGRLSERDGHCTLLGSVASDPHGFQLLNDAFAVEPLVVDIAPATTIDEPIVVVHVVSGADGDAQFPRTVIRAGEGSTAGVVEIAVGAGTALLADQAPRTGPVSRAEGGPPERLVVPVTEVTVSDGATFSLVSMQSLGRNDWVLAHQASVIGADATLHSFAVALGGNYARLRTDSTLAGTSGTSLLRAAFIGRDDQMLDFRTLQDHSAPRTTSDLLFMGAVADQSHSVYSGLIRVRRGAVRADAMQTNHNLVLDEGAHADSVPNLDIEENDVRCSHGSTVGPVDEDQRYYLESRGVEPEVAERLIVAGFFEDIAGQVPIAGTRPLIGRALADRTGVHGG
ncbi:MAG: SufB/SufD family protein [Acidimicrobiales bacterium]